MILHGFQINITGFQETIMVSKMKIKNGFTPMPELSLEASLIRKREDNP
jgi:hypothetical protein